MPRKSKADPAAAFNKGVAAGNPGSTGRTSGTSAKQLPKGQPASLAKSQSGQPGARGGKAAGGRSKGKS